MTNSYKSGFFRKLAISGLASIANLISCSPANNYLPSLVSSQSINEPTKHKRNPHPTVDFIAYPTEGYTPLTVNFDAIAIIPGSGKKEFAWDLDNDGFIDNTKHSPVFVYEQPGGVFRPVLTVTSDKLGESYTASGLEIIVHDINWATPPNVRLVKDNAAGIHNGRKWLYAYSNLQSALTEASTNQEITEIWVAEGTYKPVNPNDNANDRNATFRLRNGLRIYGGFLGAETSINQRNLSKYQSVLSGDLNGDDGPNFTNREDNSLHVVTGNGVDSSTLLDGFIIKGGNANLSANNDRGSGLINYGGSFILNNIIFTDNSAIDNAGGMFSDGGSATLNNCQFIANMANTGAGMVNQTRSKTRLENCIFINNVANGLVDPRLGGGGLYNSTSDIQVINCEFIGNSAVNGAGMVNGDSSPTLINCLFIDNNASNFGGAVFNSSGGGSGSHPRFINCTIKNNTAYHIGGIASLIGIFADGVGGSSTLTNSILWSNTDTSSDIESSQIFDDGSGLIKVDYNCIQGLSGKLGGTKNIGSPPLFNEPEGRLSEGSPCINQGDNSVLPSDITRDLDSNPRIVNGTVDMGAYEFQQ